MLRTCENSDVFNTLDNVYLVFTKNGKFSPYFKLFIGYMQCCPLKKEVLKMQKRKILANPNKFGTKIFVTFLLRKCVPTLDVFVHK